MAKKSIFGGAIFAAAIMVGSAHAATVSVNVDNSITIVSPVALSGANTFGDDMDNMDVFASFADGTNSGGRWGDTGPGAGSVTGLGGLFTLSLSGDTFSADWNLTNNSGSLLTRLSINAAFGDVLFDINPDDDPSAASTPGSGRGLAFTDRTALGGNVDVTYSIPIGILGVAPVGDLYGILIIDFLGLDAGGVASDYTFGADTDNLAQADDPDGVVPVPGALPLLATGLGLIGLAGWRRRRKPAMA